MSKLQGRAILVVTPRHLERLPWTGPLRMCFRLQHTAAFAGSMDLSAVKPAKNAKVIKQEFNNDTHLHYYTNHLLLACLQPQYWKQRWESKWSCMHGQGHPKMRSPSTKRRLATVDLSCGSEFETISHIYCSLRLSPKNYRNFCNRGNMLETRFRRCWSFPDSPIDTRHFTH